MSLLRAMCVVVLALTGLACGVAETTGVDESHEVFEDTAEAKQEILLGRDLFFEEEFNGNGRTCGTCHLEHAGLDITPEEVQEAFLDDPNGPLFRGIDSDEGLGLSYDQLLTHATMRIPITLAEGITVDEVDDPDVSYDPVTNRYTVFFRRGTPTVRNTIFENHLLVDGRLGDDLEGQATEAVQTHNEPGRLPTAIEEKRIANFQRRQFSSLALAVYALGGPAPVPPKYLLTPAQKRGRKFFVVEPDGSNGPTALCAMCHSGPLLNETNTFNPIQPQGGQEFSTNFSSETNFTGAKVFTFRYPVSQAFNAFVGSLPPGAGPPPDTVGRVLVSPDPGASLLSGDPCVPVMESCFAAPGSTSSQFKIPTLWGTSGTAPYFHDNSATTPEEVIRQYTVIFAAIGITITPQMGSDMVAYMKLL